MWKLSVSCGDSFGLEPHVSVARTGCGPSSHALIHVLDCAQAPPTVHKFLSPHHQVVQTRLCGGFIAHSYSLPEKWIKIYGPQPQYEGQIIIYVIKSMIICFGPYFTTRSFNLFLDDTGIIRNSFPINSLVFYLAWNNWLKRMFTVLWLHMHLLFSHLCRSCQSWAFVQPSGKYVYLWMCINIGILIFSFKALMDVWVVEIYF